MSPGGALAVSVMPQVCPRWGRSMWLYEARGVNDLPPCPGYRRVSITLAFIAGPAK